MWGTIIFANFNYTGTKEQCTCVFGLWSELKKRERACYLSLHWDPMFPRLLHLSSCFGPLHCFAPEKSNAFVSAKLKPTLTTCFTVTKRRTKITFRASFASFSLAFCWALSLLLSSLITENTTTLNELTKEGVNTKYRHKILNKILTSCSASLHRRHRPFSNTRENPRTSVKLHFDWLTAEK